MLSRGKVVVGEGRWDGTLRQGTSRRRGRKSSGTERREERGSRGKSETV